MTTKRHERRRVVVTGIGAITPIGITAAGLWEGLQAQRSAVRALTRFDPEPFRSRNAAQVDDFAPGDHLEAKRAKRLDRFGQFSVVAPARRSRMQGSTLRARTGSAWAR